MRFAYLWSTSVLGQNQTSRSGSSTSALPSTADSIGLEGSAVRTDRVNLGRLEYTSPQVGISFLKTEIAGAPVPEILVEFLTTPTLCQIRCLLGLRLRGLRPAVVDLSLVQS
jgi:hypothetical protein